MPKIILNLLLGILLLLQQKAIFRDVSFFANGYLMSPPGVPEAPSLKVDVVTWTALQVSWSHPFSGGTPIQGYNIHHRKDGSKIWTTTKVDGKTKSHILLDLECGNSYELFVEAFNTVGNGPPSRNLNITTRSDDFLHPPTREEMIKEDSRFVVVHLQEWEEGHCHINHFEMEMKTVDSREWKKVHDYLLPEEIVIPDLIPATWYNLQVTAFTKGSTKSVEYIFPTLTPNGEIPPPSKALLLKENMNSLVVKLGNWRAKPNCPVESFKLEYKLKESENWLLVNNRILTSQKEVMISDLETDTYYVLRITTLACGYFTVYEYTFDTEFGQDDLSVANVHVLKVSNTEVLLSWEAPVGFSDQIETYEIKHFERALVRKSTTASTQENSILLSGLKPDTEYGFQVRAKTFTNGWGDFSFPMFVKTKEFSNDMKDKEDEDKDTMEETTEHGYDVMDKEILSIPIIDVVLSNITSSDVMLTWEVQEDLSRDVDDYEIRYYPTDDEEEAQSLLATNNSVTIESLKPDTEYEFQVRARHKSTWGQFTATRTFTLPLNSGKNSINTLTSTSSNNLLQDKSTENYKLEKHQESSSVNAFDEGLETSEELVNQHEETGKSTSAEAVPNLAIKNTFNFIFITNSIVLVYY